MKQLLIRLALAAFCICSIQSVELHAGEKSDKPGKGPVGSIRPIGKLRAKDLPTLAKINFNDAMAAALTEVPGNIIKAELEIEDGNLQYSFEIVSADKSLTEVEVDAGNGKILDKDKEEPSENKKN